MAVHGQELRAHGGYGRGRGVHRRWGAEPGRGRWERGLRRRGLFAVFGLLHHDAPYLFSPMKHSGGPTASMK
ncbi:hypothetical protein GCM10010365_06750 [Streptomyces poonensis]|uniref:Uncharacterized protein n=1 Tax=Streptomyces poonensis TaxID=68255 RepID=A0A918UCU4_9ACTN|nr:hypothetical protein GCM10010365_06750 [Streptomyces poonensis]GLJ87888.1 hypothetical protein GCM10017589_04880 [Streptomyces poonensis]